MALKSGAKVATQARRTSKKPVDQTAKGTPTLKIIAPAVLPIPVGERYNQQARPDPLGRFMVTGDPWPEDRLRVSDAPAIAAKAAADLAKRRAAEKEASRAAIRAGFKR